MNLRYVIVTYSYDPNSGGTIFLHELAHALSSLGEDVGFCPVFRIPPKGLGRRIRAVWRKPSLLWRVPPFFQAPNRNIPVVSARDVNENTVVIYPEIVLGNPLGARNVVRWLLYRPGLRNPYEFGPNEMFFRAGEMSDIPELTGGAPDLYLWKVNDLYYDQGRSDRAGACYLVRKGSDKSRIPETTHAICIDGLSHHEIATIFNQCRVFYSYDEASFYSQYAAVCGCDSIVIPGLYSSREEWVAQHPPARFGVAYGLNDLNHARSTRHLVINQLRKQEAEGLETVRQFITMTKARFGFQK